MTTSELSPAERRPRVEAVTPQSGLHARALGAIFLAHLAVDMQTSSLAVLLPPLTMQIITVLPVVVLVMGLFVPERVKR